MIDKHAVVVSFLDDLTPDAAEETARLIVAALNIVDLERTDVVSRKIHNAAVDIAVRAGIKTLDLTEDLEQCKIELQTAYDRIHDLEAELESVNWDRPIH